MNVKKAEYVLFNKSSCVSSFQQDLIYRDEEHEGQPSRQKYNIADYGLRQLVSRCDA